MITRRRYKLAQCVKGTFADNDTIAARGINSVNHTPIMLVYKIRIELLCAALTLLIFISPVYFFVWVDRGAYISYLFSYIMGTVKRS